MAELDKTQIQGLLESEDFKGLKQALDEHLASDMNQQERGAALVDIATLYMDYHTKLNKEYLQVLKSALNSLQDIKQAEDQLSDAKELGEARKHLKSLDS